MTEHPITPPPGLVEKWAIDWHEGPCTQELLEYIATQAARWAADTELEACCEQLRSLGPGPQTIDRLRAARRPKPPTLKEQALRLVNDYGVPFYRYTAEQTETIRRALEALPDD